METEIYVGNLAESVTEQDLEELFSQAGHVVAGKVIRDRYTGVPRGFGFVTLASEAEAEDAIGRFDGQELQGRNLKVALARGRSPRRRSDRPRTGGYHRRGPRY